MSDMMKRAWEKVEMNEEMDERLFSQIKKQVEIRDENGERKMQMKGKSVTRKMAKIAAVVIPILFGGSIVIAMALGSVQET